MAEIVTIAGLIYSEQNQSSKKRLRKIRSEQWLASA
jgi:hypothetical protein